MAIADEVSKAVRDMPADWRVEIALALAADLDAQPTASAVKELRSLMADLLGQVVAEEDPADEIAKKRRDRAG